MNHEVEMEYKGLEITGTIIKNNWQGDPGIPNGIEYFDNYIENLEINSDGHDITDYMTDEFKNICVMSLLEDSI